MNLLVEDLGEDGDGGRDERQVRLRLACSNIKRKMTAAILGSSLANAS